MSGALFLRLTREENGMNDVPAKATLVGDPVESPVKTKKPPSRAQRIAKWRKENKAAYQSACDAHCVCSPTRAQLLLINQWNSPPVD